MGRIEDKFAQLRDQERLGLIAFLMVGYPELDAALELVPALAQGGVDMVELGVPFSDPMADGVTIQRAGFGALTNGVNIQRCLDTVKELREGGVSIPLIVMGYYNPILSYGQEEFCRDAAAAGVDGLIVLDLPPEEAEPLFTPCRASGLDFIFLLAPTSLEERIEKVCGMAQGFVYCVSLTGVTGARDQLPSGLPEFLGRVRKKTALPLAVGFGISKRAHLSAVADYADAAVVGSAIIDVIDKLPKRERARGVIEFISEMTNYHKE